MAIRIEEKYDPDFLWDPMPFTLYFRQPLTEEHRQEIREIIGAWATIGYYGGLGGMLFCASQRVTFEENIVEWDAEMDRVPDQMGAVNVLVRCLETMASARGLEVEKLVLGEEVIE